MRHKLFVLMGGFFLTAGLLMAAGCFTSPTSPSLLGQGSGAGGGTGDIGGGGGLVPTPTPGTGGGGGSISGTISNSAGGLITITATDSTNPMNSYYTLITGNGQYAIAGVSDGTYQVMAIENISFAQYPGTVTISGGNAASGIDIAF